MDPSQFLLLNGLLVISLAAFFYWGRGKPVKPTQLNLRKTLFTPVKQVDLSNEQELNVYFNFNGHMWDAYEIIGVPAGSPPADIDVAYRKARSRIDEESKEILELAYAAIQQRLSLRRKP